MAFKEKTDMLFRLHDLLPNHGYITLPLFNTELPCNTAHFLPLSTNLKRIFSHCLNGCVRLIYNMFLNTPPDIILSALSMSNTLL